ncbi:hypothetical protein SAMN06264364_12072 [Quadrisphaera granulorum]|uniref:DUF47 family protein n=1 Tax=Quadrisphaera granulorum TaxID=317664 RepID=A0A316A4R0_9ACTN|nr:DUF47 family protein [Quadrisphaera granulorum]PWJ51794.1 hypothetical protein BXY45_12072 [Quadrisphaera granulorum]SZE97741.1 hypothetical protein SAMN06264364_12072 [Quadrisphaera granulorum]
MRLLPRDSAVFDDAAALAHHVVAAADVLVAMVGAGGAERLDLADRLSAVERTADEATRRLVRTVTSSFVTPFDRGDLVTLATALDDCVDALDEVAGALLATNLGELPAGVVEQLALVQRQAEVTAPAMTRLRAVRDLADYWVEVSRLEHEVGRAHRAILADVYGAGPRGAGDLLRSLAAKEVADRLLAAARAFEVVSRTVEAIAVQEA